MLSASSRALQYVESFQWVKKHLLHAWQWKCPACRVNLRWQGLHHMRLWPCLPYGTGLRRVVTAHDVKHGVAGVLHCNALTLWPHAVCWGHFIPAPETHAEGILHKGNIIIQGNIITQGNIIKQGEHYYTGGRGDYYTGKSSLHRDNIKLGEHYYAERTLLHRRTLLNRENRRIWGAVDTVIKQGKYYTQWGHYYTRDSKSNVLSCLVYWIIPLLFQNVAQ